MRFKLDTTPICTHIHGEIIAVQSSPNEGHALFNNVLTSIKEGSHKKKKIVFFLPLSYGGGGWLTSVVMGAVVDRW